MTDIKSMNLEEMKSLMAELGEKPFNNFQEEAFIYIRIIALLLRWSLRP